MVQINFAQKSVTVKIVYYGPGMSGKTTNLEVVHQRAPESSRGELTSISTDGDRTLFFDFMPLDLGTVAGMRTQFQIYTVPGQVYYNSTRKLVLQGVDGVIFVADSSASMLEENLESLRNLQENLAEYGKDVTTMPIVIQYNKRDLPDAMSVAELEAALNPSGAPSFEGVANTGQGVFPTLKALAARVLDSIHEQTGGGGQSSAAPAAQAPPAPPLQPAPAPPQAPSLQMASPAAPLPAPNVQPVSEPAAFQPMGQPLPAPGHGEAPAPLPSAAHAQRASESPAPTFQPATQSHGSMNLPSQAPSAPPADLHQSGFYPQSQLQQTGYHPAPQQEPQAPAPSAHMQDHGALHPQSGGYPTQQPQAELQQTGFHPQPQAELQQTGFHQQPQAELQQTGFHQQPQAELQQTGFHPQPHLQQTGFQAPPQFQGSDHPAQGMHAPSQPQGMGHAAQGQGVPQGFPRPAGADSLARTQIYGPPETQGMGQAQHAPASQANPMVNPMAQSAAQEPQATGHLRMAAAQPSMPGPAPAHAPAHAAAPQATAVATPNAPAPTSRASLMQVPAGTTAPARPEPSAAGRIKPRSAPMATPNRGGGMRSMVLTTVFVAVALGVGVAIGGVVFKLF